MGAGKKKNGTKTLKKWGKWRLYESSQHERYYANIETKETTWTPPTGWGWEADWDTRYDAWYYYNIETEESTWRLPKDVPSRSCYIKKSRRAIPHPLEWGQWVARKSRRTNHWYYYDKRSRESTWQKPEGWGIDEEAEEEEVVSTAGEESSSENMLASATGSDEEEEFLKILCKEEEEQEQEQEQVQQLPPQTLEADKVELQSVCAYPESKMREAEAGLLAEWLRTEGDAAAFKVDMGDFGRPLTRQGVLSSWNNTQGEHRIFAAHYNSAQVGHIEVRTSRVDPSEAWCHWAGVDCYSMLAYVYVVPFFRSKKLGTHMVKKACRFAFSSCGAKKVLLLIQESNKPLARFYKRIGFAESGQFFYRGDEKMALLELSFPPP